MKQEHHTLGPHTVWKIMPAETHIELSREQTEAIAENARLITKAFTDLSGESLPPGRAGVVFLNGFIGRQREHGNEAEHAKLANMAACYLGEAIIAELGGRWVEAADDGLGVELAPSLIVFPFAKASKHFANGAADSVLSFFDISVILAAEQRGGAAPG